MRYAIAILQINDHAPEGFDPSTMEGRCEISLGLDLGGPFNLHEATVYANLADLHADLSEGLLALPECVLGAAGDS